MEQIAATSDQSGGEDLLDTTGLCLLSLDGGGVRGLSTLYVLKKIIDRLNHERQSGNLPPVKPCEFFDLRAGTSTGGLIAIMLGRLEMDVDQCIIAYSDLAETVFGKRSSRLPFGIKGKMKPRFDSIKLEQAIRKTISDSGAPDAELFNDGVKRGCKTFVCTVDQNTKGIVRLRSYTSPDDSNIPATLLKAALATSAATTFFSPVTIGKRVFADGGLGANNPVDEVEGEAANIWCPESGDLKPLVKCFISIGTGNPGLKAFDDGIVKFLSKTVAGIATETEETEKKFIARWRKHFDENRYFRFNVDQGLQNIGLDEYKQTGAMESATERYLVHQAQKNRVRDCIQNLRMKKNRTHTFFADSLNESRMHSIRQPTGKAVARQAHWIVPFERNSRFIGRETELAEIEGMLFKEARTTRIAIAGLGGIGKTNFVIELIHRVRETRKNCSVIWIPATTMGSLHQAYLDVAKKLEIPGYENEKVDVKKLVQTYLSTSSAGPWLLVFDNADDINMWTDKSGPEKKCERLIDYLPKSEQGNIIFTTRDKKIAYKFAQRDDHVFELPDMTEEVAMQLLQKHLLKQMLSTDDEEAKELLLQLAYLPLAIVQAAAYMNENKETLAVYLKLLSEQEEEVIDLLSEDFEDEGRYPEIKNPVATTFLISFENIRHRDSLAIEYLSFVACISPKDVPQHLLPSGLSRKRQTDALGILNAYSFITRHSSGLSFDVHRLIHLATRNWLRKENSLCGRTHDAVTHLEKTFPKEDQQNRVEWRSYLPHALHILALTPIQVDESGPELVCLAWKVARCLFYDGRWTEAVDLIKPVTETWKKVHGPENHSTLMSMGLLALLLKSLGKYDEAEPIYREVLQLTKKVHGPEHPEAVTNMTNFGLFLEIRGKYDEAEPLYRQSLQIRERTHGPEHQKTLRSQSHLADLWRRRGKYEEAEPVYRQILQLQNEILGLEHPDTLTTMNNLGLTLHEQEKYEEAESVYRQAIQLQVKILGPEHPYTITGMDNLGVLLKHAERYEGAERIHRKVLELEKRVFGQEHPETLKTMQNLGELLKDGGKPEEAEQVYRQILQLEAGIFGPEHPDTLRSMYNLALVLCMQGRYKRPNRYFNRISSL